MHCVKTLRFLIPICVVWLIAGLPASSTLMRKAHGNRCEQGDGVNLAAAAGVFENAANRRADGIGRDAAVAGDVVDPCALMEVVALLIPTPGPGSRMLAESLG
jgi:hypothetical protein